MDYRDNYGNMFKSNCRNKCCVDIQGTDITRMFAVVVFIIIAAVLLCACSGKAPEDNTDYVVLDEVPEWSGEPFVKVNGNKPEFTDKEIDIVKDFLKDNADSSADNDFDDENDNGTFEVFDELDRYGRCGTAAACVGRETMPEGERGSIGMIQPSGWQISKYDFIDNGGYLYNRCHLIGWQLTGQNEEIRNLITGTRYMNTQGMLPFENQVAEYVRRTGNHVLYRVTPFFDGEELLARGVNMEAYSLEDEGDGISFNVFCYNVQPGVTIDYKTGKNKLDESTVPDSSNLIKDESKGESESAENKSDNGNPDDEQEHNEELPDLDVPDGVTYILNTNTMRFHRLDCEGAKTIKEHNREWFYGSRQEAIDKGFAPCGMCKP